MDQLFIGYSQIADFSVILHVTIVEIYSPNSVVLACQSFALLFLFAIMMLASVCVPL